MLVYDVVQIVSPQASTITSYRLGTWLIEFHEDADKAFSRAERMQACCRVDGIKYAVEAHDEESNERRNYHYQR
jgi:hypothetical protein